MKKNISYQRVFGGLVLVIFITVYSLFTEEPEVEFDLINILEAFWVTFKQLGIQALLIGLLLEIYNSKSKDTPPKLIFISLGVTAWVLGMIISQQLFFFEAISIKESFMAGVFIGVILSWWQYWVIEQENNAI